MLLLLLLFFIIAAVDNVVAVDVVVVAVGQIQIKKKTKLFSSFFSFPFFGRCWPDVVEAFEADTKPMGGRREPSFPFFRLLYSSTKSSCYNGTRPSILLYIC